MMARRFLLVVLNIDAILAEVTIRQRRRKLEEMTQGNGLDDAYTATLTRVKAEKGNKSVLGLKVLMWVSYSERPLRAKELCHALGVEIGSVDLDPENIPALRTLLASCLGLVTVEASSSIVRLVHFTLHEYLLSNPTLFSGPHATIAEVCLTYLNFESVMALSPALHSAPSILPLLEYSSYYWGKHTRMGTTENVKILALRLLARFDEHISAQLLLLRNRKYTESGPYFDGVGGPTGFTGLHGASFLGIVEVVADLLEIKKWNVNAVDCTGSTALIWAARKRHEGVVKILLERAHVDPNQAHTEDGRTPLDWAAAKGHEGVVRILLERWDVDPNKTDSKDGRTPLDWAAVKGHEGVVKILLEREDVDPNKADTEDGRTPLDWAAAKGHEGVVRILLEREDVDPNKADPKYGGTPLLWAALNGYEGVVKLLLEREDLNPDQAGTFYCRTPLEWAALGGHEGVVKILLERREVNPNYADPKYGRTALSLAAENGHEGVIKMLLERRHVDPNQADTFYGQTPLSWAAENGREGIVKILLDRGDINPDQADTFYGRTPLAWAAQNGREGVVKILLEREGVNPDQADTRYGRTPLSLAAENGQENIVKMLLAREDINPSQTDTEDGRTPLAWAAVNGHSEVVQMLSELQETPTTTTLACKNKIPLSLALVKGHNRDVGVLRDNVNSHTTDRCGQVSLPFFLRHRDEHTINIQSNSHDLNTNVKVSNSPPAATLAHLHYRERILRLKDRFPKCVDRNLSSTKLPLLPQPPFISRLKFSCLLWQTEIHPNNTRSALLFAPNRYFIIASFFCLLVFLVYLPPPPLPHIFSSPQ